MKFKTILFTIFSLLLFLSVPSLVSANTLYPHTNELLISNQERTKETVYFRNDSKKDIYLTPVIYLFDPQTVEIKEREGHIFTRADREIFTVKPEETLELDYEVVPTEGMGPGTYFNLIVLEKQAEETFVTGFTPIGAVDNIAHLVVLHIADSDNDVRGISSDFALISIEVVKKGIPFIRPMLLRYTYQNTTNYVLNPMGEIQIYSERGSYPPISLKINSQEEKLYPKGFMEEEFSIDSYYISDLFSKRIVIGRFYNGIDDNLILQEVIIKPHYTLLVSFGVLLIAIMLLLKLLFSKKEKRKKTKENSKENSKKGTKKNSVQPS